MTANLNTLSAEGNDARLYHARAALWDIGCTLPESELRQAALDALALIDRPGAATAAGRAAWIGAVIRDLKALPEGALPDDSAELMMTESELRAALFRHAPGLPSYSLADYQPGQWWLEKLEALWGSGAVDLDTRRAAKVACNLAAQVFATLGALPQTPPVPAGAGSSSTPRVDALMAKWDDDGATRGAAFCELRDLARELERDALPAPEANASERDDRMWDTNTVMSYLATLPGALDRTRAENVDDVLNALILMHRELPRQNGGANV